MSENSLRRGRERDRGKKCEKINNIRNCLYTAFVARIKRDGQRNRFDRWARMIRFFCSFIVFNQRKLQHQTMHVVKC